MQKEKSYVYKFIYIHMHFCMVAYTKERKVHRRIRTHTKIAMSTESWVFPRASHRLTCQAGLLSLS